ncbi:MAG: sodium:alanine symporter [Pasteurellales bacterium]|nr:MAG: sodium:alanine symporter [Pasteurellales bacterium]
MEVIKGIFGIIDSLTWGWSLIPMLIVFGVLFTIVGGFAQFRYFGRMFRVFKQTNKKGDGLSGRQALLVSIGGRVGGGNIAGIAVAISLGGPGAVFWMWLAALIGMMTSIVECSLAQLYKRKEADGTYRGGPAFYIVHGLGKDYRFLATIYAVALTLCYSIGFNAFQGNTVAGSALDSLGIDRIYTGIFLAIVGGIVIFGGIKRIAKAADVVVPIMSFIYILLALIVILLNITEIPHLIATIVKSAFGFEEVVGGGMGAAIAQGMRRGLFSNEAGLGSAPNVAATAEVRHPVSQGISQALSVFIDTMIICSATAFIILLSDVYVPGAKPDGVVLTQQALVFHFGEWVKYLLTFAILLFSFSSIIFNYYMGENGVSFLFGKNAKVSVFILRISVVAILFIGAAAPRATAVFFFSDPLMGVLAVINLLALIMLFPRAVKLLKDYQSQLDNGVDEPVFDAQDFERLDIDMKAWNK